MIIDRRTKSRPTQADEAAHKAARAPATTGIAITAMGGSLRWRGTPATTLKHARKQLEKLRADLYAADLLLADAITLTAKEGR